MADETKHDFSAANDLLAKARQAEAERQRQVVASTLRDGMAKDNHAALGQGKASDHGQAMQRFEAQQRSDQANRARLEAAGQNAPEPERDPQKWLRDDQAKEQADRAAETRQRQEPVTPATPAPAQGHATYTAYSAQHQPNEPESRAAQRLRELDTKAREARIAAADATLAELERVEQSRAEQDRRDHAETRQRERQAKLDTAARQAAAQETTEPQSRYAALHARTKTPAPAMRPQEQERAPENPDNSRYMLVLAAAAQDNQQNRRKIDSMDAQARNAEQMQRMAERRHGAQDASRYEVLHREMTDRAQRQASRETISSEATEKKAQRINSGDGKTTKADIGIGD